ncbi:MAG: NADP-reducing hydrogenase subunit HndA [candidate division WS2 bacterium]|uniref:NADP-reducing hydrogenase subunit HndA n=1 Tax=Psychracetigena formicireducens TaxID=2986056 RepID=A0A9E2F6M6_PSYF1|nr:NADP-reducing hydrogenase subunit HndA [Candidatus Psychracetigena formicireducens]MBT9144748.1 NADP-reducing hydrogenase subunit HndA [Candidatus Psychracetigena formicireducens]MBT9150215.1 NADP-reducing hydrogenase subunit HndA [Candidatus Psychracetigena formicireducens]
MKNEEVGQLIKEYKETGEPLLTLLHKIQNLIPHNHLPAEVLKKVSRELKIPVSSLYSTASFYSMFSLKPRGKHIIRVCSSPPCKLEEYDSLIEAIGEKLNLSIGETTCDGQFTLEEQSCLGLCSLASVMMVDNDIYKNVTVTQLPEILDTYVEE